MDTQITGQMLGKYLRHIWEKSGQNQKDFIGLESQISLQSFLSMINEPSVKPQNQTITKVCDRFNCSREDIINYNDEPVRNPENIEKGLQEDFTNADQESMGKPLISRPKYAEPFAAAFHNGK